MRRGLKRQQIHRLKIAGEASNRSPMRRGLKHAAAGFTKVVPMIQASNRSPMRRGLKLNDLTERGSATIDASNRSPMRRGLKLVDVRDALQELAKLQTDPR